MKAIIGISGSILVNKGSTFSGYRRSYVNQDYVDAVLRAGAVPLIIPFNEDKESSFEMLKAVDGLILSGGHDVDPKNYGEEPLLKLGEIFPERDEFDFALFRAAMELKKPVFGICRGFQVINVINGGSLYQDLSYADFVKIRHDQSDNPTQVTHSIELEADSFLRGILGSSSRVNSFHHQIIKQPAPGFRPAAKSPDGVIEAIERIEGDSFVIGVQWHPEMLARVSESMQNIFNCFVEKVIEFKNRR